MARTRKAILACARWLSYCIEIGWEKNELDDLEALWWKYHDDQGHLIAAR